MCSIFLSLIAIAFDFTVNHKVHHGAECKCPFSVFNIILGWRGEDVRIVTSVDRDANLKEWRRVRVI